MDFLLASVLAVFVFGFFVFLAGFFSYEEEVFDCSFLAVLMFDCFLRTLSGHELSLSVHFRLAPLMGISPFLIVSQFGDLEVFHSLWRFSSGLDLSGLCLAFVFASFSGPTVHVSFNTGKMNG